MRNRAFFALGWVLILAATIPSVASSWVIEVCDGPLQDPDKIQWLSHPRIRASAVGFPEDGQRANALQAVIDRWNDSPADFRFNLRFNDRNVGLGNGQNEAWFSENEDILDGAPAVTFSWDDCGALFAGNNEITEVDVVFACDSDWASCDDLPVGDKEDWYFGTTKTVIWNYGGNERPFRTTAMHEFGHALGLKHENSEYNVMGQDWTHIHVYGSSTIAYPGEDASDGAVELYGLDGALREDVSVVHWKYAAPDGEYTDHIRTQVYNNAGNPLACDPYDAGDHDPCDEADDDTENEPIYQVNNGQTIQVEFTFENSGSSDHAGVEVGYYLSTNTTFGLGDQRLGGSTVMINRNSVFLKTKTLTLPSNLVSGNVYYILAFVDEEGDIDEIHEDNNLTYVGIKVN
jgi:hypothetical protein